MSVKQQGTKWVVYSDSGEVLGAYACRGEAERENAKLTGAALPADLPEIEEEEATEDQEEEATEDQDEEEQPKFLCPHCDFVAKNNSGLTSHLRAKHGEEQS